jgi:Flp pilus assembly pilin Flp
VLLRLLVAVQATRHRLRRDERGQTTAEYALVLVGVAAIALLVVAWATDTNKIGRLLDGVLDSILDQIP